jgi:hypothetical protein
MAGRSVALFTHITTHSFSMPCQRIFSTGRLSSAFSFLVVVQLCPQLFLYSYARGSIERVGRHSISITFVYGYEDLVCVYGA